MKKLILLCSLLATCSAAPASATVITRSFDFTASDFEAVRGGTPPFSTVTGSFTVTFDTAILQSDAIGVTVDAYSIPFAPDVLFSYNPASDRLVIGARNAANIQVGGTNDFVLAIMAASTGSGALSHPQNSFSYVNVNFPGDVAQAQSLSIRATTVAAAVPEPATWAMLIAGFGLAGAALRRQRPAVQAAFV